MRDERRVGGEGRVRDEGQKWEGLQRDGEVRKEEFCVIGGERGGRNGWWVCSSECTIARLCPVEPRRARLAPWGGLGRGGAGASSA